MMKINPVLEKEIKIRMRGWRAAGMIGIYLTLMAVTASFAMIMSSENYYRVTIDPELALGSYLGLAVTQFVLISFISPALTTGAISGEREKQTLDLLLCTRMTPLSIVIGKLFASISQIILLIIASLPIFSTVFLFGAISVGELLQLFGFFILIAITFGSIGIFYSCYFKRTTAANVLAYGTIAFLCFGTIFFTLFYVGIVYKYDYEGMFPILYGNPIIGFISILAGQFGEGNIDLFPGLFYGNGGVVKSISPWIGNLIFNIVLSVTLLLLSAKKINPLKKRNKTFYSFFARKGKRNK